MANKLNINVSIEGIRLPLQVSTPEEEKMYRDAATTIQRRIQRLRDTYPDVPNDKTYYVMAMLNTAVEATKASNRADTQPYTDMMHDIEKEISGRTLKRNPFKGFPSGTCQCRRHKRSGFDPWVRKRPWRRICQLTPVFLPGESHEQRSLVSCSP